MPETETPPTQPKKSFTQMMAEGRPATKEQLESGKTKADSAPTEESPKPTTPTPSVEPAKAAPAASAPTAPAADPDEEIIAGKRNPKGEDFKRVKHAAAEASKQRDEFKGKVESYEKELTELRKAPKHNAELIKTIEKERDEFKNKWEGVAAQFDPAFQQKYQTRIESAIAEVKPMLPADRAEKISQLLTMPHSQFKIETLKALTEDLDQITVAEIMATDRTVRGILSERQGELVKSGEILTNAAEERQRQAQERAKAVSEAFNNQLQRRSSKDSKEAMPMFQTRDGDSDDVKQWNAAVEERIRVAKAIHDGNFESESERADAAFWAAQAPGILEGWKKDKARLAELEATLAKLQSATPGITGGSNNNPPPKKTFTQRMVEKSI